MGTMCFITQGFVSNSGVCVSAISILIGAL